MSELRQREEPIRSQEYLRGAKDSPCTFIGPMCNCDPATSVPAHLNGAAFGKGMGGKAHDIAILDACFDCHAYIDIGHGTNPLMSDADFYWHLLRGVVLTMVNRARRDIITVPQDAAKTFHATPTKPRKPKAARRTIQSTERPIANRGFDKSHTRKMDGSVVPRERAPIEE